MTRHKSLGYILRYDGDSPRLLAFRSHDADGYEIPRGSLHPGETPEEAVIREIIEESGLESVRITHKLGINYWQDEAQHFFILIASDGLPETFTHKVQSDDGDNGMVYVYRWLDINFDLHTQLVEGCDYYVDALLDAVQS